jgi:H+/Cl- antiporter ClcA
MFDSTNLKDNRSTLINYSSALFLGVVGGIFAVLWLQINDLTQALRMRFITKAVVIYAEAALFSLITSISLYFLATLLYQDCVPKL